jgi:hypothetical protein
MRKEKCDLGLNESNHEKQSQKRALPWLRFRPCWRLEMCDGRDSLVGPHQSDQQSLGRQEASLCSIGKQQLVGRNAGAGGALVIRRVSDVYIGRAVEGRLPDWTGTARLPKEFTVWSLSRNSHEHPLTSSWRPGASGRTSRSYLRLQRHSRAPY